jgi:CheY-like chemotaxis protein
LQTLSGERPAVIVPDFMVPHMTGGELGTAIRQDADLADILFLFISGTNEEVVQRSFGDYDGFLPKPYDVDALLSIVDELASGGCEQRVRSRDVDESMRHLLKGIELPSDD